jgi:two-component system sensor histidine kinase UhpB
MSHHPPGVVPTSRPHTGTQVLAPPGPTGGEKASGFTREVVQVSSRSQAVQAGPVRAGRPARRASALDQLTRRAESDVKRRLARDLHDSVAQILTVMVVDLEAFKRDQAGHHQVVERAESLQASTREVLQNLRGVLYELREQSPTEDDFVQRAGVALDRFETATGIHASLDVSAAWPSRLGTTTAHNLSRILEEALNNVLLHSGATSVRVELEAGDRGIELSVRDDGSGPPTTDGVRRPGMGLVGMRERAVLLGGELEVTSNSQGGTTVRAVVPDTTRETVT